MSLSPMMRQYLDIKEKNKDALLMFRLGDFYEMFFDDAITASRELDLVLTGRDCGLEERAPMCGIPFHALDNYLAKLIAKGYKVAICEQLTPPGKGLVDRQIVRIVTPGTLIESDMLSYDKNNYLVSIACIDGKIGAAWTDISTGEFKHICLDKQVKVQINELLSRISPSEIICNQAMLAYSLELSIVKYGEICPFTSYNELAFDYNNALKRIKDKFEIKVIDKMIKNAAVVCAAGALLSYLDETQKRTLDNLKNLSEDVPEKYMSIDMSARKTLELLTNTEGQKRGALISCIDKTHCAMGVRMLRNWILQPLLNVNEIAMRSDGIEELVNNSRARTALSEFLSNIADLERICAKLSYENILPNEFLSLAKSLLLMPDINSVLQNLNSKIFNQISQNISKLDKNIGLTIKETIREKPSSFVRDGDVIAQGYDKQLDEYIELCDNAAGILQKLTLFEREETGIKNLKISYNKVFGYYIDVPKSQISLVPYRYIRKQTTANSERYFTEELKELETKILEAHDLKLEREAQIYSKLISNTKEKIDEILSCSKAIAYLDCLVGGAIIAIQNSYIKPNVTDNDSQIKILEGRHPVVEKLLKGETFVPNDTLVNNDDGKIMLITGPNMAGKSIYMRQVALIVILAQMGYFVPAKEAHIGIVDKVFTRVGASDDLNTGRSTFMVEMSEVSNIIENVTDKSLVLLDEIGRGTSTYDGLSIAWSVIEYLSQHTKARTLFSTHYHELTELEGVLSGIKNYKFTVRELNGTIIFLRKLLRGSANRSFGIEVAALSGLPKEIITKAKQILKRLESVDLAKQSQLQNGKQSSLFENENSLIEISRILKDLDIDAISPRNAFDILIDLKEKAVKNG